MEKIYGGVCVSLATKSVGEALAIINANAANADLFEVRLDALDRPAVEPFSSAVAKPLLFTNRPKWEGGGFVGNEEARLDILHQAVNGKAAYIDIELRTETGLRNALIQCAAETSTRTIVSWHNFETTPSDEELEGILEQQRRSGATIGKIVTMAHNRDDVLRVLALYRKAGEFPLSAFCMGEIGAISRVAALPLGAALTYASADGGRMTAPGQLAASTLKIMLRYLAYED